jgi:hypothetical protein
MIRTPLVLNLVVLVLSLTAPSNRDAGRAAGPGAPTTGHEHLGEVACVDVPPGEKRP